jgi:oligopeptide/dipeptide ABC transporter ATP-binding protein
MGAERPLLEVRDLRTHFHTRRGVIKAVDGASFTVDHGETLGIVGESGSGKSVTCLSIVRLVPEPGGRIVSGQILFEGEDLLHKNQNEMRWLRGSRIAMILQDPMVSLNPAFSIGDQIAEPLWIHLGLRGRDLRERVVDLLRQVRISDAEMRVNSYPHQLSGGMRQRVAGAIAVSCQPSLLIADEPTTALDVTIQAQYLHLLKDIQRETNVGLIFVTHDLGIVAKLCDRVAVMYAGRIVESGTVREIFNSPRHPYTIGLLNCLPRSDGGRTALQTIPGQPPDMAHPPPGCCFAPRCVLAEARCSQRAPDLIEVSDGHLAACWRAADAHDLLGPVPAPAAVSGPLQAGPR